MKNRLFHSNLTIILIFALLLISSIENHQLKKRHLCVHDEKSKLQPVYVVEDHDQDNNANQKRVLQQSAPSPMRVTFNFDKLDLDYLNNATVPAPSSGTKQDLVDFIKKQAQGAQLYINHLIKIIPASIIKYANVANATCGDVSVPQSDITDGQNNSDLHIYVNFDYNTNSSYLAFASACIYMSPLYRPTFGYITYNFAYQNETNFQSLKEFEDQLEVTIHELTHVLGFSSFSIQNYWYDPETKKTYKNGSTLNKILLTNQSYRGKNSTNILTSPRVRDYTREYYNCSSLPGMQLENEGSSGSLGSHWERIILENEYMTASAITSDAAFSKFTSFLLMDTGWYDYIDLSIADEIQWGKNKGCKFFDHACYDNVTQYPEFSYLPNETRCTFDNNGIGTYSTGDTFDDQCPYIQQYSNADCSNEKNYQDDYWNISTNTTNLGLIPFTYFGYNSRCLNSTLFFQGYTSSRKQGCYQFNCLPEGNLQIILDSSHILNCTQNGQQTFNVSGYSGSISCPTNIQEFCGIPDYCSKFCNSNGICLNEVCHCFGSYIGTNCSVLCSEGQFTYNNTCFTQCPTNTAPNPANRQCEECSNAQGYFYNNVSSTCEQCFYGCKTCYNSNDICSSCDQTRILNQSQCLCRDGFYEDQKPFCLKCGVLNCKSCNQGFSICSQCLSGYYIEPSSNYSLCLKCSAPCLECMNKTDNCIACQQGQVLFYNSSTLTTSCIASCPQGYFNFIENQYCYECALKCLTCQNENYTCTSCRSTDFRTLTANNDCICIQGYFESATNLNCLSCQFPCSSCQETAANCTTCLDGYFLYGQECQQCFYACLTCQNANDVCLKCDVSRNLVNSSCVCKSGFYEKQQAACGPCLPGCQECTTSSECLLCQSGFNLVNSTCVSQCLSNQFLSNNVCENCSSSCLTCEIYANYCLTCNQNLKLFNNTCVQTCPGKTVAELSSNQCVDCYQTCENCINSTDICTSCNSLQFRTLLNSQCVCLDGYYDDYSQPNCQKCQVNCLKCQSSNSCIICSPGYYYQSSSENCQQCWFTCLTCSSANDICTSCEATRILVNNISCVCKDGYFETQQQACTKCNVECATCGNNASNCITCAPGYNFTSNNLCTPTMTCTSKQFLSNGTCLNCSTTCASCQNSATFCLSCTSPQKLFNNTCISTCPNGTVVLSISPTICSLCNFKCQSCSVSQTNCTLCNPNFFRKILNNACICQDGYWDDNANATCKTCKLECATCSAADSCLTCKTSYVKDSSNNCVLCDPQTATVINAQCVCNSGYYLDMYSKNCTQCYYQCKTCGNSSDICTSCDTSTRIQVNNSCLCRDGYYEDYSLSSPKCLLCEVGWVGCASCTQQGCETCKLGFYFESNSSQCRNCSYGCDNCTDPNACLVCKSPQFFLNTTTQTCQTNCLPNQFLNLSSQTCANCSTQCKQCYLMATNCTSCISGLSYFNNSCLQICPLGYVSFKFNNESVCNPCIDSCRSCSLVEKNCTSCNNGTFLQISSISTDYNLCVQQCKNGFFADLTNNQCTQCDKACLTCLGISTNCTACVNSTLFLNNGSCVQGCLSNQFINLKVCYNCDTKCKTCVLNGSNCTSCSTPLFLSGSSCLGNCPPGTYGDTITSSCLQCHFSCLTCTSSLSTSCVTCNSTLVFTNGTCKPRCNITSGQYFDNNTNVCQNCSPNCLTCFGQGTNQCLSCKSPSILNFDQNICVQNCPDSTFNDTFFRQELNQNISVCRPCAPNCLTCNGSTPKNCLTCNTTNYFTFEINTCFCNSFENRVYSNDTNSCKCSPNSYPITVTDPTNNSSKQICSLACPPGQYGGQNATCFDCNKSSCTQCSLNANNCTSCLNNTNQMTLLFINRTNGTVGDCRSTCPLNYLNQNNVCLKCHESCQGCAYNLMNCTNCASGYSRFNSTICISQNLPPYGYYYDQFMTSFQPCNVACTSCFGADFNQCNVCSFGYIMQANSTTCVKQCPIGCSDCLKNYDQYCLNCTPNFQLQILNPSGMYIDSQLIFPGKCVSNCSVLPNTSTNTNTSLTSQTTKMFFFGANDRCIIKCPEIQKFNNGTHCLQQCPENSPFYIPTDFTCVSTCPIAFINSTNNLTNNLNNACVDYCPMNTYFDNLKKSCSDCDASCLTCFGSDFRSCTSCPPNYFLTVDKVCVDVCSSFIFNGTCVYTCPSGTFSNVNNSSDKNCYFCHPTCGNCSGSNTSDSCLTCASPNYFFTLIPGTNNLGNCSTQCPSDARFKQNMACVNQCLAGYFPNTTNFQCQPCRLTCRTCKSYDFCTECINNNFTLNEATGTCTINITCPQNCIACSNNQICSACIDKFYLYNNTCQLHCPNNTLGLNGSCQTGVNCPSGQFNDYTTNLCVLCSPKCLTCTNQTVCQTCAQGFTFRDYQCLDNNICDTTCAKCNGPLNNNCTLCLSVLINNNAIPLFLFRDSPFTAKCINSTQCPQFAFVGFNNNTCVDVCPDGFYADKYTKLCKRCNSTCQTCTGPSEKECVTCPQGMTLIDNENYCVKDSQCYPTCQQFQCSGPQKNQCKQCANTSLFFYNNECLTTCPSEAMYVLGGKCLDNCSSNYYVNPTNNYCTLCPRGCETCLSATQCLTCRAGYTYDSISLSCQVVCQDGTYMSNDSTGSVICLPCIQSCAICSDNSTCQYCYSGYFKSESLCVAQCPSSQYGEQTTRTCNQCNSKCELCKGPSEFSCLSCNDSNNYLLFNNGVSQCVENCPPGYFGINTYTNPYTQANNTNFCQVCHFLCKTCEGPASSNCTSCPNDLFLNPITKSCVRYTDCPASHYPDFSTFLCLECNSACLNCSQTATWCTSCKSQTQFLYLGQCIDNCSTLGSYYGFTNNTYKVCLPCHSTCQTCNGSNSSQCLTCPSSLVLNNKSCVSNCSVGQFQDAQLGCLPCSSNCSTCYSIYDTACTSCKSGFFLNQLQQCVSKCDSGYFADSIQGVCKACDQSCQTCSGTFNNCTSCPQYTYQQGNTCVLKCTDPYYFDQTNQACYPCFNSCSSCFGASSSQCLSCARSFYFSQYSCVTTCPIGQYGANNSQCQLCHGSCLSCNNYTNTSCTSCRTSFLLQQGQCVLGCPSYLVNSSLPNCYQCNSSTSKCLNCTDPTIFFVNSTGQCQIINCDLMATSSLCKSCKIGFGLAIDGRLCIDNSLNTLKCARYDTDGKTCKDCISGWGLDPISKQCSVNLTTLAIAGCTKYINTTACEECSTFYGLKDNTCIDNSKTGSILYCKEYQSQTTPLDCIKCQQDYGLNTADKKCFQITYTFVNNALATWNTAGKYSALDATCPLDYLLYPEGCVSSKLIGFCTTYFYDVAASKFKCKQCQAGLVPSSTKEKCIMEVPGCYAYNADDYCTSCNKPLTFQAGKCITQYLPGQFIGCRELNDVCLNCWTDNGFNLTPDPTTGQCSCANGAVLNTPINNAQWYCAQPKQGCPTIATNCTCKTYLDQTKCKECWNSTFMFSPDSTQCLGMYNTSNINCTYQWRSGTCFQCKTGQILIGKLCKVIPTTRANYLSLCAEANSNYICTRCKIGYKLNSTSTTIPCYQTTTSGRILQAQSEFLYSYCSIYDENRPGYCLECLNPQIAIEGVCYDRLAYCDQQNSPYSCDSCFNGFSLKEDGTCEKNPDNLVPIENCLKYDFSDFNKCVLCQSGSLLSTSGQYCLSNCKIQDEQDPSKCAVASLNYVSIQGSAVSHQEAVQTYENANYCSSFDVILGRCVLCQIGYGLFQGTCVSNSLNIPNCQDYSPQSLQSCSQCIEGFIPVKGNSMCYLNQGATKVVGCNMLSQDYDGINNNCDPKGCDVNYIYDIATKTCIQQQELIDIDNGYQKTESDANNQKDKKVKLSASYIALIVVMTLIGVLIIGVVVVVIKKKQKLISAAKIRPISQNDSQIINNSNNHNSTLGIINNN